jgi:proline iminopeptidase
MLDAGDGQSVYWEQCGNPAGKPAVVLHGGPGSGCTPGHRRWFDPDRYRIVLLDQRNCGRSRPHASEEATDLSTNTTGHLIADLELLRTHLGIERWLVVGGSFGCVLGLAYAQRHPSRVTELVLYALATGRQAEVDLLTRGLGPLFPEAWARFHAAAGDADAGPDILAGYARRLASPDPRERAAAAKAWCAWEDAMTPTMPPSARYEDPAFRLAFTRIVTHYWGNGHFLGPDGALLAGAGRLAGIPGVLVQGRLDLSGLAGTPWLLAHALPDAELVVVDEAAHETATPGMAGALLAATDRFASKLG